jgi:predicted ATPase/DNA-binding SARP family transcriptional activator
VYGQDGRQVQIGGRLVRALLILLALDANRVVPAYSLIERLWADERPADAANALQSLVSRLRGALRDAGPGLIESSPAGYRLAVPTHEVDAIAFEACAADGGRALADGDAATAAHLLREALAAWRGPALADVAGQDFAAATAARLEELRYRAVLDRIEAGLMLGSGGDLVAELRALTAAEPLGERPRALLMRALAAAGRQAEALTVYQAGRELLADRLGVDPPTQLEQVYLGILRQEAPERVGPTPPGPRAQGTRWPDNGFPGQRSRGVPGGRPPGINSFVGRDDDISGVLKKLGTDRLVTLTGPGGVGKTRLASEVSALLGVSAWLVELAPVTDPAAAPSAVLDALGIRERVLSRNVGEGGGAADPIGRLADALAGLDVLLVIDNCEHLVEAAAALAGRLLADCPRLRIVATSREPLRIDGETLFVVSPLRVPPPAVPDMTDISCYPAVQLLRDRASAVLPGFEADRGNSEALARICRALDGMPLAIELAAVWLRTLTPAQLAERLDDRFALLTGGSRTALPRHKTLRAVVAWSWDLLSGPERALARRLAVFPAGATLAAAERVCALDGDGTLPRGAVLPALSGLVEKSILAMAVGAGDRGPRYRMLETVRAYGMERLAETGDDAGYTTRSPPTTWTWRRPPTRCCAPRSRCAGSANSSRSRTTRTRRCAGPSPKATRTPRCGSW